jgi:hypothetical protein
MKQLGQWRVLVCAVVAMGAAGWFAGSPSARDIGAMSAAAVVTGLNGPRGVTVGPAGRLVYTENDGSFSEFGLRGRNAGAATRLGSVPATFIAPAIAMSGRGQTFVLTAGGAPGSGSNTLYRWNPGRGVQTVADIAAYQATDPDPFNLADPPEESNPFGVAVLPDGSVLVSDAAANDLLRVYPDGSIVTVARLKPRVVAVPEELPDEIDGQPLPPAGTLLPSEGVATSVTVGADGYYYVGELRGFPATPGTSQVWRIAPDSVNAICDPQAPSTGACQRYADGFTSIVSLAAGPDGSIYVVELVKRSWFQWEQGLVNPPVGSLFRIPSGGGTPIELAAGQLILPAGVAVSPSGAVYVTGPVFGPGAVSRIE